MRNMAQTQSIRGTWPKPRAFKPLPELLHILLDHLPDYEATMSLHWQPVEYQHYLLPRRVPAHDTTTATTTIHQCPSDHLHICVSYNAISTSTGPSPYLYLVQCSHNAPQPPLLYNIHWTTMSVSYTILSQGPTTTTTIYMSMSTGTPPYPCLVQHSHKAPQWLPWPLT